MMSSGLQSSMMPAPLNDAAVGAAPPPRATRRAAVSGVSWIIAATAIGIAVDLHGGEYTPWAIALVTVGIAAALVGLFSSALAGAMLAEGRPTVAAFAACLALQVGLLACTWPVGVDQAPDYITPANHIVYLYLLIASVFLIALGVGNFRSTRRIWFIALLIVHAILAFWTVRWSPTPHIDVWHFEQRGPQTLLGHRNPYDYRQAQFPDIYDSTAFGHQRVYGEGMVKDGMLQFGFPYPPVSLFCSTLGVRLGNDTRYAQAAALTLAAILLGYSRTGRESKLAAALLLFTPTAFFVLGRAWTEPFVVLFLTLTIFCASRRLRWLTPVAFGLFLASKQYLVFAIPLSFLLVERFDWRSRPSWLAWGRLLLGAGLCAAAVTLPLALWDLHAFWFSLFTVQRDAPFRWDALSYLVWIGFHIDTKYTTWVWMSFAAAVLAVGLSMWRAARSPAGFAAALALTYALFIAFNKQAFCNYYFFVIGCLCCAVAAGSPGAPPTPSAK